MSPSSEMVLLSRPQDSRTCHFPTTKALSGHDHHVQPGLSPAGWSCPPRTFSARSCCTSLSCSRSTLFCSHSFPSSFCPRGGKRKGGEDESLAMGCTRANGSVLSQGQAPWQRQDAARTWDNIRSWGGFPARCFHCRDSSPSQGDTGQIWTWGKSMELSSAEDLVPGQHQVPSQLCSPCGDSRPAAGDRDNSTGQRWGHAGQTFALTSVSCSLIL